MPTAARASVFVVCLALIAVCTVAGSAAHTSTPAGTPAPPADPPAPPTDNTTPWADTVAAPADTAQLRRQLGQIAAGHAGVTGISIRNLDDDASISIRGHETFPSASLIKVPILVALLEEVEQGRMRLDERITMVARDRVGGSGILKHMATGTDFTIEDLAWLMIVLSDNTATNLILDKLDVRTVWTKMEALGLPHSKIHSKTFRRETSIALDSSAVYGLGVTTPDEIVQLLTMLHHGRAVSPALDSVALGMLRGNQDANMMTRMLPSGVRVAHKSGSVDRARTDCGIMYTAAAPIALCVMTRENEDTSYGVDSAAHLLIAQIARAVYDHYNPASPGTGADATSRL